MEHFIEQMKEKYDLHHFPCEINFWLSAALDISSSLLTSVFMKNSSFLLFKLLSPLKLTSNNSLMDFLFSRRLLMACLPQTLP